MAKSINTFLFVINDFQNKLERLSLTSKFSLFPKLTLQG
jgi:hypothetical protein